MLRMTQKRAKQIACSIAAYTIGGQMDCNDYMNETEVKTPDDEERLRKAFRQLSKELLKRAGGSRL